MDSDDQNFASNRSKIKCDIDNNIIDDYKADLEEDVDQCVGAVDGNGNRLDSKSEVFECTCMRSLSDNQLDEKIMRKLQAMSIADDDYGEWLSNVGI